MLVLTPKFLWGWGLPGPGWGATRSSCVLLPLSPLVGCQARGHLAVSVRLPLFIMALLLFLVELGA